MPLWANGFVKAALQAQRNHADTTTAPSTKGAKPKPPVTTKSTGKREERILTLLGNAKSINWIYKSGYHSFGMVDKVREYMMKNADKLRTAFPSQRRRTHTRGTSMAGSSLGSWTEESAECVWTVS